MSHHRRTTDPNELVKGLAYMEWHRRDSIREFLGHDLATQMKMIDLDCVELCHRCDEAVALIETTRERAEVKKYKAMLRLAQRAHLPAFVVQWLPDPERPLDNILGVRVKQVSPTVGEVVEYTPEEWSWFLVSLRTDHYSEHHRPS